MLVINTLSHCLSKVTGAVCLGALGLLASAAQAQTTPAATYRIHAGGGAITTSRGNFAADQYYSPSSGTLTVTDAIAGTTDQALFQSERYSTNGTLSYALPVPSGQYQVVLHFAEIYWTQVGQRVFDINLESKKVLGLYDIVKKVGTRTATSETFTTNVTDGTLNIDLSVPYLNGGADQAKLSAFEVVRLGDALATRSGTTTAGFSAYPNPTAGAFTLACTAPAAQTATLVLTDVLGRTVQQHPVSLQTGANRVPLPATGLPAGLYHLTLRLADGQHQNQQLLIQP